MEILPAQSTGYLNIVDILLTNSWFKSLPNDLQQQLIEHGTITYWHDREIIHYQNDESHGLYAVISGSIKVSSVSADGRECVFRYLAPGSWFGEIGMLDKSVRTHDAQAIGDSVLLTISAHNLTLLLEKYPVLYKFLALLLCRVVRTAFTMLHDSTLLSVSARLAKRLVSFAEAYGEPCEQGVILSLYLTQDDLARVINTTRQTINKRLVDWQKLGWIDSRYGKVVITNMAALQQLYLEE